MPQVNSNRQTEDVIAIPKSVLWISGIACAVLIIVFCIVFGWKRYWNTDYAIDHEVWGTLGDFIGGFLGSIFALLSVYLMYLTFQSQRVLTRNSDRIQQDIANKAQTSQEDISKLNIAQAETQRFNDLFFELLHRYQALSEELTHAFSKETDAVVVNYFDSAMEDIKTQFRPLESYARSITRAQRLYTEFYLANATHLAPLFRTLYRIMELIESSDISTKEKLRYAKIIRAQLRESELFFLRYNCLTSYGDNFIEYINMYRLTKHLPIMSLLEFKYIKDKFGDDELISLTLNMVFRNVWRTIYGVTVGRIERSNNINIEPSSGEYKLSLDMSSLSKTIFSLSIDKNTRNRMPLLKSLSKLNYYDLRLLMKYFLLEVYRYSNFSRYNDTKENQLKFDTEINTVDDKTVILATVKSNIDLRLSHPKWDEEYGIETSRQ